MPRCILRADHPDHGRLNDYTGYDADGAKAAGEQYLADGWSNITVEPLGGSPAPLLEVASPEGSDHA